MKISDVEIKESVDGELYFTLPDEVFDRLKWKEGDELIWDWRPKHNDFVITKSRYETIELDLSDEVFTGIARMAHDNDITFNKQIELILKEFIDTCNEPPHDV